MKKRFMSILLALLLCACTVSAYADSAMNEARKGVARVVEVLYVDGEVNDGKLGTAFFVGKEGEPVKYLMTNYHVVEDYIKHNKGDTFTIKDERGKSHSAQLKIEVFFDSENSIEAYPVAYDEKQDIALLKLEKSTDQRISLPLMIPTESMVGDAMYVVGYPGNADDYIVSTSAWGVEDSLVSKGTIGRITTESGTGTKWIQSSDLKVTHGNSGGPLLSEDGAVIGMCCAIFEDGTTSGYMSKGVNIEPVVEMLRANSIEFTLAGEKEPEVEAVPTEEPVVVEAAAPAAEAAPDKGLDPVIVASVAAVVVAAAVVIVVLSKKKKPAPVPASAPTNPNQPISKTVPASNAKTVSAVIRSMAPQHNGKKLALKDSVVIGRANGCAIIFKEGTPGVSGKHCAITWDKSNLEFIVKDLNSSYGTFTANGMKLEPGKVYRMKPGESLYLGEKENTLRLEIE